MTVATVPRPPAPARADHDDAPAAIDWPAVGIVILTAIPVTVAYLAGLAVRCARILVAATIEAYLSGRGMAADPEPAAPPTVAINGQPTAHPALATVMTAKEANR